LHEEDNILRSQALLFWSNYIETGNINTSRQDLLDIGDNVQLLSASQEKLVSRLKLLAHQELTCSNSNL